jgi:ATP-binding cassette, subfamily C, bacterial CydCD
MAATAGRTALIVTHRPEQTPGVPELRIGDAHRSPAIV